MTIKPADERITEDDAFIAHALESANIPALMMSLVHLGDISLLDGDIRPKVQNIMTLHGSLSEADQQTIRARALKALAAYRDSGSRVIAQPPSPETIGRMTTLLTGSQISAEYIPMLTEDVELDGVDRRSFTWSGGKKPDRATQFQTVIIGAGLSGIAAAIRLKEAGMPFVIYEKNDKPGGTWWENSYPGCRVDSSNHFYSYSFEPNHDWSEYYCRRDELFRYFEHCVDKYGLRSYIRYSTEVVEAIYDSNSADWRIKVREADGTHKTVTANAVISAVGQLNRPQIPNTKGRETFRGPAFHAAQWQHEHDLRGKRVAVVGTSATGFQLIPELAEITKKLTVFQRSPAWMAPNPNYFRKVEEGKKWLLKHVPYYARWYRFLLFYSACDGSLPAITIDPTWPHMDRSINALNEQMRVMLTTSIEKQLEGRPDLIEKLVPKYPPAGKRMLQDNGYYLSAYKRNNVELVTDGISEIVEDGIIDQTGQHHPVDVIVYATGFNANKFLWPMRIVGKDSQVLSEVWGDEPRAYLGITVPGFPNLFCLYGPATNLAHGGSIIFQAECQVRYVMDCLKFIIEGGNAAINCKPAVYDNYVQRLERALAKMVWSHPGVNNWYKNARGVVVNTSPWRLVDYWNWTKSMNPQDYEIVPSIGTRRA